MKILVIGANGQIGSLLVPMLLADGHQVVAMVRDASKGQTLESHGAKLCIADLEGEIDFAFEGINTVVFTAGSGSTTGKDKTLTVDLWGAVKSIHAAEKARVRRFIMVSALKAKAPEQASEGLRPYLVAKASADAILQKSSLNYCILRPGRLHDNSISNYRIAPTLNNFNGNTSRKSVAEAIQNEIKEPCGEQILDVLDA